MCGLLGYIGKPKDYKATFDLTNALMDKTEIRGIDATGFWACINNTNKIFYHKEPVKSSEFIKRDIWKDTSRHKIDLMLGHCRYTSSGSGNGKYNKNNHPHVSKDFRVSLIHNGKIPEYPYLKKHYPVSTDCDSEILLRIFESGEDFHDQEEFLKTQLQKANPSISNLYRIYGLKKIFSEVNYGAMAVALGEHLDNNERALWLFHNEFRPLCLVDLRETMGQFFFCSTQELFRAAVDEAKISSKLIPMNQGVIKLPSDWIYNFRMDGDGYIKLEKIKINKTSKYGYWDKEEEEEKVPKGNRLVRPPVEVVTRLNAEENVIEKDTKTKVNNGIVYENGKIFVKTNILLDSQGTGISYGDCDDQTNYHDTESITDVCEKGIELFRDISTNVQNSIMEGNMSESEVDEIVNSLNNIVSDLMNTKYLIR